MRPARRKTLIWSYFTQLRSVSEGIVARENSWIGLFPDLGSFPIPMRGVPVAVLQNVLRAIRSETSIEISYQSLSRPDPVWRWIAPHAIGYDGFRWHVRAWCEIDNVFKDFLFSRIRDIRGTHPAAVKSAEDVDWHSYVEMVIGPHPDFSDSQKAVIADDYGMVDGRILLTVRKALLYYALKRFGLDMDPSTRRPADQQIVLLNRTELFPSSNIQTGPK
ncbi:WYL domain-containing protein [Pseudophaeobacter sp. TrK17]|uniref:WYL domain-containing protein n=1 Tax=Pseudophaeobacter sp. TrK17 TaxID=2815167 RepID=UPI0035CE87A9